MPSMYRSRLHFQLQTRFMEKFTLLSDTELVRKVQEFNSPPISLRSAQRDVKKFREDGTLVKEKKSGAPTTVCTKSNIRLVRKKMDGKTNVSGRKVAAALKCSEFSVRKMRKMNDRPIVARKRQKVPLKPINISAQKVAARKLNKILGDFGVDNVILDDETYITLNGEKTASNSWYYTSDSKQVDWAVKFISKEKFPSKLLVHMFISSKGVSLPTILPSGTNVNATVYVQKCLKRKLVQFIEDFHGGKRDEVVFWPDKAASHYAKSTITWLNEQGIQVVPKLFNPTSVPECRPIERCWAELKRKVFEQKDSFLSLTQLQWRIMYCWYKTNWSGFQKDCLAIRTKLRKLSDGRRDELF